MVILKEIKEMTTEELKDAQGQIEKELNSRENLSEESDLCEGE